MDKLIAKSVGVSFRKVVNLSVTDHLIAFILTIVTLVIGEWDKSMTVLITLQIVDVISGLKKGKKFKSLDSGRLKAGANSKFGGWLYVIVGNAIDSMIGLGTIGLARSFVISYLTLMELMSISENAEVLSGIKAPYFITKYFAVVKNKMDNTELGSDGRFVEKSDNSKS